MIRRTLDGTNRMSIAAGTGAIIVQWVVLGALLVTGLLLLLRDGGVRVAEAIWVRNDVQIRRTEAQQLLVIGAATAAFWFGLQVAYAVGRALYLGTAAATKPLSALETATVPATASLLAFGAAFLALGAARGHLVRSVGLTWPFFKRSFGPAAVGYAILLPVVSIAAVATQLVYDLLHVTHPAAHELLLAMDEGGTLVKVLVVGSAVIAAPLFEEVAFRGLLQGFVTRATGRAGAGVLVGALAFAALHAPWTWPAILLIGLLNGAAYERTQNLWVPILMHAAFNATSVAVSFVAHALST